MRATLSTEAPRHGRMGGSCADATCQWRSISSRLERTGVLPAPSRSPRSVAGLADRAPQRHSDRARACAATLTAERARRQLLLQPARTGAGRLRGRPPPRRAAPRPPLSSAARRPAGPVEATPAAFSPVRSAAQERAARRARRRDALARREPGRLLLGLASFQDCRHARRRGGWRSPKTCGCRRTSFSAMPRHAASVNRPPARDGAMRRMSSGCPSPRRPGRPCRRRWPRATRPPPEQVLAMLSRLWLRSHGRRRRRAAGTRTPISSTRAGAASRSGAARAAPCAGPRRGRWRAILGRQRLPVVPCRAASSLTGALYETTVALLRGLPERNLLPGTGDDPGCREGRHPRRSEGRKESTHEDRVQCERLCASLTSARRSPSQPGCWCWPSSDRPAGCTTAGGGAPASRINTSSWSRRLADGSSWAKVIEILHEQRLPHHGGAESLTSLADDVATTRRRWAQPGPGDPGTIPGRLRHHRGRNRSQGRRARLRAAFGPDAARRPPGWGSRIRLPPRCGADRGQAGFRSLSNGGRGEHFASDLPEREARLSRRPGSDLRVAFEARCPAWRGDEDVMVHRRQARRGHRAREETLLRQAHEATTTSGREPRPDALGTDAVAAVIMARRPRLPWPTSERTEAVRSGSLAAIDPAAGAAVLIYGGCVAPDEAPSGHGKHADRAAAPGFSVSGRRGRASARLTSTRLPLAPAPPSGRGDHLVSKDTIEYQIEGKPPVTCRPATPLHTGRCGPLGEERRHRPRRSSDVPREKGKPLVVLAGEPAQARSGGRRLLAEGSGASARSVRRRHRTLAESVCSVRWRCRRATRRAPRTSGSVRRAPCAARSSRRRRSRRDRWPRSARGRDRGSARGVVRDPRVRPRDGRDLARTSTHTPVAPSRRPAASPNAATERITASSSARIQPCGRAGRARDARSGRPRVARPWYWPARRARPRRREERLAQEARPCRAPS